ncbi:MAG: cysteine desulfurase [Clostridia bacterium]|nr:cysteine desulfurase [Clostridia bacterium]
MNRLYFDHASTTKLDARVLKQMMPYLENNYGNANSTHFFGRQAVKGLDEARELVASLIGAKFGEVYFTSGGTECDNWALCGLLKGENKGRLVISSIEHSAMLNTAKSLENNGTQVFYVKPDKNGFINAFDFNEKVDKNTVCALMLANNEIGTIQPVREVALLAKQKGAIIYSDAVQAMPALNVNAYDLGVDMLGFSAHKFNGPKGVGCAFIKNGVKIAPYISGGHQERSLRGGTSNVAGAIGLAYALKYTRESLEKDANYVADLRNDFIDKVLSQIPNARLNGSKDNRLPNNANIMFEGINGDALLYQLDINGVSASLGAACSAGSIEPSHVLKEIGLTDSQAFSSLRFTFGKDNTQSEIDFAVTILKDCVLKLRNK